MSCTSAHSTAHSEVTFTIPIYTIFIIDDNSYVSFYHTLLGDNPKPFDGYKTGKATVISNEGFIQLNIICFPNSNDVTDIQGIIDLKTQLNVHGVILVTNSFENIDLYQENFINLVTCSTIQKFKGIDFYSPLAKQEDTFPIMERLLRKIVGNFELIIYKIN